MVDQPLLTFLDTLQLIPAVVVDVDVTADTGATVGFGVGAGVATGVAVSTHAQSMEVAHALVLVSGVFPTHPFAVAFTLLQLAKRLGSALMVNTGGIVGVKVKSRPVSTLAPQLKKVVIPLGSKGSGETSAGSGFFVVAVITSDVGANPAGQAPDEAGTEVTVAGFGVGARVGAGVGAGVAVGFGVAAGMIF